MEQKIKTRAAFVQGKGSVRVCALMFGVSVDTAQDWCTDEGWIELREAYDKRQLEKLMGDEPKQPTEQALPEPTGNRQVDRLARQIQTIEEQMEGMTNATSLRDLSAAHSRLFDAWCTLTGTQKPGTRKASRQRQSLPQIEPVAPTSTPPVVPEPQTQGDNSNV